MSFIMVHFEKGVYLGSGLWSKLNSDNHDYALCYSGIEEAMGEIKPSKINLFSFPEVEGESEKWPGYIHKTKIPNYW
jgi:hypothetical protein